jgi:hypothetical protein
MHPAKLAAHATPRMRSLLLLLPLLLHSGATQALVAFTAAIASEISACGTSSSVGGANL